MHQPIQKWHIIISGFLQDEGRPTGMVELWRSLRKHANPTTCVELRSWNDDWRALAELIYRCRPPRDLVVQIYGYSWGGYSATVLARELARREINVQKMVLSDAVYRHWYWLGQWRAFWPGSKIVIPSNVHDVTWFYQRKNFPRGHVPIAEDARKTLIHPGIKAVSHVGHVEMDDLRKFHDVSNKEAVAA